MIAPRGTCSRLKGAGRFEVGMLGTCLRTQRGSPRPWLETCDCDGDASRRVAPHVPARDRAGHPAAPSARPEVRRRELTVLALADETIPVTWVTFYSTRSMATPRQSI